MKKMKKIILIILSFLLFTVNSFALVSDRVSFEEGELRSDLEKDFFVDLDKGELSKYTLYDAFLIASGITKFSNFIYYQGKLAKIRERALREVKKTDDPYIAAKNLLFWLHDNIFKKYRADATLANDILDNGEFNCLSGSILYTLLAKDLGLKVVGVVVKDHAFCMLVDSRGDKDIETTIRYGFDPGTKEIEQLKEFTRYVYVPKKEYTLRRTVNTYQLIGALYSNLVNILSNTEKEEIDYDAEIPKYKKGYYFDQESAVFKTDIEACLNNLALKYIGNGDYDNAYRYIRQAKVFNPKNEDFKNLEKKYFSERGIDEAKKGNFEKGIGYLKIVLEIYPSDEKLLNNLAFCYISWGNLYFEKQDFENALIIFLQGLKDTPKDEALLHNIKASYYNLAVKEYKKGNYARAIKYSDEALKLFPDDKSFIEIKQASQGLY
ncbi:MAG: tetratricopeptide repeat protein [Elusimicrobia bacterium]|nr:tetratricopeptide repeat protein [Elusimicrobiota bacterium]